MNSKNLNIILSMVLLIAIIYGGSIQENIKAELRRQIELTGEVEYRKGYIQGWKDGRKPIKIDTVYHVDTVITDTQFLFIKDNIGTELISISNDKKNNTDLSAYSGYSIIGKYSDHHTYKDYCDCHISLRKGSKFAKVKITDKMLYDNLEVGDVIPN